MRQIKNVHCNYNKTTKNAERAKGVPLEDLRKCECHLRFTVYFVWKSCIKSLGEITGTNDAEKSERFLVTI